MIKFYQTGKKKKTIFFLKLNTSKVETHSKSPLIFSQMEVVASKLAVANNFPEGDQAHDRTVLVCVSSRTACSHPIINHKILPTQESTKLTQLPNQTHDQNILV